MEVRTQLLRRLLRDWWRPLSVRRLVGRLLLPELRELRTQVERLGSELAHARRQFLCCRSALVPPAVRALLDQHRNVHLAGGGLGDAWLTVAQLHCERDPYLLFAANAGSADLAERIFRHFNIPTLITPGFHDSAAGLPIFYHAWEHPHCRGRGYLPADLDFDDWARRPDHYTAQLASWLPVRERFGCAARLRPTARMVALAPRGSRTCRPFERKWLDGDEYRRLVAGLLAQDCTVVTVGSEADLHGYGLYPHPNHVWLSSDWRYSYPECRQPSTLEALLGVVNGCDEVIAVDTWLKTYSALACVPTTVLRTRYDEPYTNPGDHIFLNPIWGFRIMDVRDALRMGFARA